GAPDSSYVVKAITVNGRRLSFTIFIEAKYPERKTLAPSPEYPTIEILMGDLLNIAKTVGGSFEENTRFVHLLLEGLSKINKIWPLSRSPFFYSDRSNYVGRENLFPFRLPSDDEIARL